MSEPTALMPVPPDTLSVASALSATLLFIIALKGTEMRLFTYLVTYDGILQGKQFTQQVQVRAFSEKHAKDTALLGCYFNPVERVTLFIAVKVSS